MYLHRGAGRLFTFNPYNWEYSHNYDNNCCVIDIFSYSYTASVFVCTSSAYSRLKVTVHVVCYRYLVYGVTRVALTAVHVYTWFTQCIIKQSHKWQGPEDEVKFWEITPIRYLLPTYLNEYRSKLLEKVHNFIKHVEILFFIHILYFDSYVLYPRTSMKT